MVVVFVVVLILVDALVVTVLRPQDGDDRSWGPQPWYDTIRPELIEADTNWNGRTGVLDQPIWVRQGARLSLIDCDLELRLEDVVTFQRPFFEVFPGGVLELERTTLRLTLDPWLETSILGPSLMDYHIPVLSRVVDLSGTTRPRFAFDVKWMDEGCRMALAVQRSPDGRLERIATFGLQDHQPRTWTHHEASLDRYAGTVPRLVLYFEAYPRDLGLFHNLTVTDTDTKPIAIYNLSEDDFSLRWDTSSTFTTGLHGIASFLDESEVIQCRGRLAITDSEVLAPEGLQRGMMSTNTRLPMFTDRLTSAYKASDSNGLAIDTVDGVLEVTGSTFERVPVIARSSQVSVNASTLRAGSEMMTFEACTGSVGTTRFEQLGPRPDPYPTPDEAKARWCLSIENNTPPGQFEVRGCTFVGAMLGLDLGQANVSVEGCTFQGITRAAVWDHISEGFGGWEGLSSMNTFTSCTGDLYLRTSIERIEFTNETKGVGDVIYYDDHGSELEHLGVWPDERLVWARERTMIMLVPVTRVGPEGSVIEYTSAEVYVWGNYESLVLDMTQLPEVVDLEALARTYTLEDDVSLSLSEVRAGDAPGSYQLVYGCWVWSPATDSIVADVYVDDQHVRTIDLPAECEVEYGRWWFFNHTIALPDGECEVTLVLRGLVPDAQNGTSDRLMATTSDRFVVVDETTDESLLCQVLGIGNATLLIAQGTSRTIKGVGLELTEGQDYWLRLVSESHAALDVTYATAFPGNFTIAIEGLLDVCVGGVDASRLFAGQFWSFSYLIRDDWHFNRANFTLANSTLDSMATFLPNCSLKLSDVEVRSYLVLADSTGVPITLERVRVLEASTCRISTDASSISITECSFTTLDGEQVKIISRDNQSVEVVDTVFNGTPFWVSRVHEGDKHWSLDVHGCDFAGEGAVLVVLPEGQNESYGGDDPRSMLVPGGQISGNTFRGVGSGAILHPALVDGIAGRNAFQAGSRLYVNCRPDVDLQARTGASVDSAFFICVADPRVGTDCPLPIKWEMWNWISGSGVSPGEIFIDITDGPGRDFSDEPINVYVVFDGNDYYHVLTDIVPLDPTGTRVELTFRTWPDLDEALVPLLRGWPWPEPGWARNP